MRHREIVRCLRAGGFAFDRQAKGSHEIWYNAQTRRAVSDPNRPGDLPPGTVRAILRDAGVDGPDSPRPEQPPGEEPP